MATLLRSACLLVVPALLLACSGSSGDNTATPMPPATSAAGVGITPGSGFPTVTPTAPAALSPMQPDGGRIHNTVEMLATAIGPRVAGQPSETQAADLLAGMLRSYGFEVEVKPITVSREVSRESQVTVVTPEQRTVPSIPLTNSAAVRTSGNLIAAGIGRPEEIPLSAQGAVLLIERGELTFQQKVENAQAAGAAGVLIYNNAPGTFLGSLSTASSIPAIGISEGEGEALLTLAQRNARVDISVGGTPITSSHNVIARPPGKQCETVTGGHFDSVPVSPGANDNASGTATVVEIAGVLASQGKMESHCFVLFGAEEIGLVGSKAYVESLSADDKAALKAMLNFDMVGFGSEPWYLIGSSALQSQAAGIASGLGIQTQQRNLASTGGGSDHASFINAGIPAVFFYRADDPQWHQPGDTADRIAPALLEEAARMGVAMLEALAAG